MPSKNAIVLRHYSPILRKSDIRIAFAYEILMSGFMLGVVGLLLPFVVLNMWLLIRWQRIWRYIAAIPAAIFCVWLVQFLRDVSADPTSHNLWPFEIIFGSVAGLVFLGIASFVRSLIPRAKESGYPAVARTDTKTKSFWVILPLVVGLIAPSLIILMLELFVGHIGPIEIEDVAVLGGRQFNLGRILFGVTLFGLIPFVVLSSVCFIQSKRITRTRLSCLGIGGLLGILFLMVPAHHSVWYPLCAGKHMRSTAFIVLFFTPFCCLFTLGIGLLLGWIASLLPFLQRRV